MFFILSKTLYAFILPATWLLLFFFYFLISKNEVRKKKIRKVLIGFTLLFTNPFIINQLLLWWEIAPTPFANIKPYQYEVAVVLTGVTADYKSPKDRIYFNRGADRVLHTARLYRESKVRFIVVSGAEFSRDGEVTKANRSLKDIFVQCNIPEYAVITEMESRNTHENAVNTAKIIQQKFPKSKILLVSSAFHLRRARACFEKEGMLVDTFSTDFYASDAPSWEDIDLVAVLESLTPSVESLTKWNVLIREIVGYITYRILGYA
jgi:uncharacterized SAM-binding protein YcdF (DUF218 family)